MADTKISALTAVAAVAGANEFAVNEAGTSKKASATQIKTFVNGLTFLGRTVLAVAGTDITVSFTARKGVFLLVIRIKGYSAAQLAKVQVNGDTANNYGSVASEPSDAAATSTTNTSGWHLGEVGLTQTVPRSPFFVWCYKEAAGQIALSSGIGGDGSEAPGTVMTMIQTAGIWNNTADLISSFTVNSGGAGTLTAGSFLEVYGIDNA